MGANAGKPVDDADAVEVIGLNGATLVACGTSLPVVRRLSDGMICRFVVPVESLQWLPGSEFERFLAEGRVSRFKTPIRFPFTSLGENAVQPLVLFANDVFLEAAAVALPEEFHVSPTPWTNVVDEAVPTWATCLPSDLAKQWLNESAARLRDRIDTEIAKSGGEPGPDRASLLRWSDLALCAATEKSLRWQLYLRYGDSMEPDRVRRTFDAFVQREFPSCSWDFYLKEMKDLADVICSQRRLPSTDPTPSDPHHYIRDIAKQHPRELTLVS